MEVYIHGSGIISPQQTWSVDALAAPVSYQGNRLTCIEPDYASWLDVKQLRRMSRIMKMGAASALLALKNAGVAKPDSIITGTGWGCLEDTGIFLNRLINNKEDALNPTAFIQSTHNTIGSHLALLLQCQGYNQTYSHGAFSFESALLDAMLQLSESPDQNILVGGADEITDASHAIQSRFGIFKNKHEDSLDIFKATSKGTLHGEGSAWFVISGEPGNGKIKIIGVKTVYKPAKSIEDIVNEFLSSCNLNRDKIDFLLLGKSGDFKSDKQTDQIFSSLFKSSSTGVFKHLCGEYPVAVSFALWLASSILKSNYIPSEVLEKERNREVKAILIYNQYFRDHHSLILLNKF
jgi:3-oxoacyl-[acyl-carrier-protein] synthase II